LLLFDGSLLSNALGLPTSGATVFLKLMILSLKVVTIWGAAAGGGGGDVVVVVIHVMMMMMNE